MTAESNTDVTEVTEVTDLTLATICIPSEDLSLIHISEPTRPY